MKTSKNLLLTTFILCLAFNVSQAQKMYQVHVDYVKPSKMMEYDKIAKEFTESCKKYNPKASWITTTTSDLRYMYVSPMENFAELDNNIFADMATQMGDSFQDMFKRFNTCYDEHGDYVLILDEALSYMPSGITQTPEGENYRQFIFLYYTPENQGKLNKAVKAIKDLFSNKGSKQYYRIYRSGFGVSKSYYMVAIAAKDELDLASKGKSNEELLGDDRNEPFQNLRNSISGYEEVTAQMRPELYYSSSN